MATVTRVEPRSGAEWWRSGAGARTPVDVARPLPPGAASRSGGAGGVQAAGARRGAVVAGGRFAFAALLTFTIILIGAPQERLPILAPFRIALLSATAALLGFWFDRWTFARRDMPTQREWVWAGLLLGWAIATVPVSYWPLGSVTTIVDVFAKSLLIFWLLGVVVNTFERLRTVAWTLTLLTLPLAFTALQNFGAAAGERRIRGYRSGLSGNPNDLALTLVIIMPFAIALALAARRFWPRLVAIGLSLLSAAAIVVTFSRSGFVALVAMTTLYLASWLRQGRIVSVSAVGVVALIGFLLVPSGYSSRLGTISAIETDPTGSAQARWRDINAAIDAVARAPVSGAGIGQDILMLNEIRGDAWISVHNVYLQYAVDLGLPGLVLFLGLLGTVLAGTIRTERRLRAHAAAHPGVPATEFELARALRISLTTFALAALFYPVAYYFYFFYLAGLAVALQRMAATRHS